jgi:hypothetical protein
MKTRRMLKGNITFVYIYFSEEIEKFKKAEEKLSWRGQRKERIWKINMFTKHAEIYAALPLCMFRRPD